MDDIELVIKIPEKDWEFIKATDGCRWSRTILEGVINGRPLPKGHGKLIDEKEIDTVVNGVFSDSDYKCSPKTFLNVIHNQCIEAVGADSTESEE